MVIKLKKRGHLDYVTYMVHKSRATSTEIKYLTRIEGRTRKDRIQREREREREET